VQGRPDLTAALVLPVRQVHLNQRMDHRDLLWESGRLHTLNSTILRRRFGYPDVPCWSLLWELGAAIYFPIAQAKRLWPWSRETGATILSFGSLAEVASGLSSPDPATKLAAVESTVPFLVPPRRAQQQPNS
jgi:hypothetical protein